MLRKIGCSVLAAKPIFSWLSLVLTTAFVLAVPAEASCVPPAAAYREIDALIYEAPQAAIKAVDGLLTTNLDDNTQRARLLAIKAEALGRMSQAAEALKVAGEGMAIAEQGGGVRTDLLWILATNSYDTAGLQAVRGALNAAILEALPNSADAVCLNIALGSVDRISGNFPEAARLLIEAYRRSDRDGLQVAHIEAARLLARLMSDAENTNAALDLNQIVLDYETAHNFRFMLGFAHGFRGAYLVDAGRFSEALDHLNTAKAAAVSEGDEFGEAYLNQHICRAQIGLQQWGDAKASCEASSTFLASKGDSGHFRSDQLLAEIELHDGQAQSSLDRLNSVIAGAGPDMGSAKMEAFRLRSAAFKQLSNAQASLDDMERYLDLYQAHANLIRDRQSQLLQAQFGTDLKIAENASLKTDLRLERQLMRTWQERGFVLSGLLAVAVCVTFAWIYRRNRYRRQLLEIAKRDDLTGLSNRRDTIDRINALRVTRRRAGDILVVALMDLDRFKRVNDTYGHSEGDNVLRSFANCLTQTIGSTGVYGRWGGEEFICVFADVSTNEVSVKLEALRVDFRVTAWAGSASSALDFSVGLTPWDSSLSFEQVLEQADTALYQAKNSGRGQTSLFVPPSTAAYAAVQ